MGVKISELAELTDAVNEDEIVIVDKANLATKKINIKNLIKKKRLVVTTTVTITANTDYEIPEYTLGNNSLSVFFEGIKLIKNEHYVEVDTTHIQFKDWDVPIGSHLEFIYR